MRTLQDPPSALFLQRAIDRLPHEAYIPDEGAPEDGEWVRGGPEPRWRQAHSELVRLALRSWKGHPAELRGHINDELSGAPDPGSGNGKIMRMMARALLWELRHRSRPSPRSLYRGSHVDPVGIQSWSERRGVAREWARKNAGKVFVAPRGTMGLRVLDYATSAFDSEQEWIVDAGG